MEFFKNTKMICRQGITKSEISKKLFGIIVTLMLFWLFGFFLYSLDASQLPDFEAYYLMYYDGENLGLSYRAYYNVGLFAQSLGMDYQDFRALVLGAGIAFSAITLSIRGTSFSGYGYQAKLPILKIAAYLTLIFVFVFEYYVIRLRAGLSIFFFSISFSYWQYFKLNKSSKIFRKMMVMGAILASAIIHLETWLILVLFVCPAAFWSRYLKLHSSSNLKYFIGCFGAWLAMFWLGINPSLAVRGPELAIALNPIRFISISIAPIAIWLLFNVQNSLFKESTVENKNFPHLFQLNYIASAAALFFYYYFSVGSNDAGEAIVRVMTLSSFGAILSIVLGGITFKNGLTLYIILINSLFFINTIYG